MRLDWDALVAVMRCLRKKHEISSVMKTCKTLYAAGLPLLIAEHTENYSIESAMSYLNFLRADKHTRGPLLRTLELDVPGLFFEDVIPFLAAMEEALQATTQPRDLELYVIQDQVASSYLTATGHCSSLAHLELHNITCSQAADLLSRMFAPLKSVKLHFSPQYEIQSFRITEHLRKFIGSLQDLRLLLIEWIIDDSVAVQWTSMTSIETSYLPRRGSMSAAFPNLRNIVVHRTAHGEDAHGPTASNWIHLDYVAMPYPAFRHLLPSCTTRQLRVYTQVAEENGPAFEQLLRSANPSALILLLHVSSLHFAQLKCWTRLWQAASRLECLILDLKGEYSMKSHVRFK